MTSSSWRFSQRLLRLPLPIANGARMRDVRSVAVGLIGAGGMGTRHAENLHRHVGAAHLAAAYDLDRGRAEQVAALCGAAVYDDPLPLIWDDRIEAVIIAS